MRLPLSIFLLLVMMVRPFLPLLDYAAHYQYICKNVCENRDRPEMQCNGKCYLAKEIFNNHEKQTKENKVELLTLDSFIIEDTADFQTSEQEIFTVKEKAEYHCRFRFYQFYSKFFHPPLA